MTHATPPQPPPEGPGQPSPDAEAQEGKKPPWTEPGSPTEGPGATVHQGINLPYLLPSRGVLYGGLCKGGHTTLFPIRGEQEELLAGAGDGVEATPVFRHVVAQLVDLNGLAYEDLLLSDWVATLLNLLAFSYDPIMRFKPRCPHCHKFFPKNVNIEEMKCDVILDAKQHLWVEPFKTPPLPLSKEVVEWRLLRLSHMIQAEDWARAQESYQMVPGSPLHTYTVAKHILKINGEKVNILQAIAWVRNAIARDLRFLSEQYRTKETGYDLSPKFTCPHCGGTFTTRLPLDGSFFRAASAGDGDAAEAAV